jgi:hypothetical protein
VAKETTTPIQEASLMYKATLLKGAGEIEKGINSMVSAVGGKQLWNAFNDMRDLLEKQGPIKQEDVIGILKRVSGGVSSEKPTMPEPVEKPALEQSVVTPRFEFKEAEQPMSRLDTEKVIRAKETATQKAEVEQQINAKASVNLVVDAKVNGDGKTATVTIDLAPIETMVDNKIKTAVLAGKQ